ncbi:unnamed protein product [Caenorhabditis sp. 36 PRJEB53466]|nr:unnamed protein product [Caenorhabditis sp. 36 PRJEB53466]
MDSLPTYSSTATPNNEQTFGVSSELARLLGCDRTEAALVWEGIKALRTEQEVQKRLEETGIWKPESGHRPLLDVLQLVQRNSTCMTNS